MINITTRALTSVAGALLVLLVGAQVRLAFAQAVESWLEPTRVIYPGELVKDDLLVDVPASNRTESGPVATERALVIGKVARRTLLPHHPIALSAVADPPLVISGRTIVAIYVEGLLSISGKVMALHDGRLGDLIQVRSLESGKVLAGIVQPDGAVRMPIP
jgi:flagellar basal body P-ring formation protein FlgA